MLLLFSVLIALNDYLMGKSCSFGLLCVSIVNVYQFVFGFGFEDLMWYLILLILDHCLFIYFTS